MTTEHRYWSTVRVFISVALGWTLSSQLLNATSLEIAMWYHVVDIIAALFLPVAVPIDRNRAARETWDMLRDGMSRFKA